MAEHGLRNAGGVGSIPTASSSWTHLSGEEVISMKKVIIGCLAALGAAGLIAGILAYLYGDEAY